MVSPVVHFEIMGTDGTNLRSLYADLFGWAVQFVPAMNYGLVDTQAGSGINGGIGTSGEGGPQVIFYIEVPDPQESLDAVEAKGGTTVAPVDVVPDVVTFAQFADPEGNVVGLVKAGEAAQEEGHTPSAGAGAAVSYFEVFGPSIDGMHSFYRDLFGWAPLHGDTGGVTYVQVDPGGGKGMVGAVGDNGQGTSRVISTRRSRAAALLRQSIRARRQRGRPADEGGRGGRVRTPDRPAGQHVRHLEEARLGLTSRQWAPGRRRVIRGPEPRQGGDDMRGKVVHFEIPADDIPRAEAFYRTVFGWHLTSVPGMDYTMAVTTPVDDTGMPTEPGSINGGMFKRNDTVPAPVIVIEVEDIDQAAGVIEAEGGVIVRPKDPVGDMGWVAYFKDSEGNLLGVWQNAQGAGGAG